MICKGDLVVHAQGTLFPQGAIRGVVVDIFGENDNFYKVFWYTTGRYQNLRRDNLKPILETQKKRNKT
jgi:hypothetical protein